ncbi:MAG: WD40 repeat domain-containing protein, partial [Acidimicrobiales bacterium]
DQGGGLTVWAVPTGAPLGSARHFSDGYTAVSYTSAGLGLFVGRFFGGIEVWSGTDRGLGRTLDNMWSMRILNALAASVDGATVVSAHRSAEIYVWDLETGRPRVVADPNDVNVLDVAFSPDSSLIASAGDGGSITIWDSETGERLQSLVGHTGPVNSIMFAPDGKTVVTAGADGTVRIHLVDVPALIELAESRATRQFTAQECDRFRLVSDRCRDPADAEPDVAETVPTHPEAARTALLALRETIAAGDAAGALDLFAPDAFVVGWVIDTTIPGGLGSLEEPRMLSFFRGGLESAAAANLELDSLECSQGASGGTFCSYEVAGPIDPERTLEKNLGIEIADDRIVGWFNLTSSGPGAGDLRAFGEYLVQRTEEEPAEAVEECMEIHFNDASCRETLAPYIADFLSAKG